jgi:ArsR family transcriptional regulator
MGKTKVTFNVERLQYSADVLYALAHPLRLRILEFIDQNERINVNQIYRSLHIEQSITSQHLRILRLAGIVQAEKEGKYMHYSIHYDTLRRTETAINGFMKTERVRESAAAVAE